MQSPRQVVAPGRLRALPGGRREEPGDHPLLIAHEQVGGRPGWKQRPDLGEARMPELRSVEELLHEVVKGIYALDAVTRPRHCGRRGMALVSQAPPAHSSHFVEHAFDMQAFAGCTRRVRVEAVHPLRTATVPRRRWQDFICLTREGLSSPTDPERRSDGALRELGALFYRNRMAKAPRRRSRTPA